LAKPVVDGIERDLQGRVRIVRLSVTTRVGSEIAQRFGVRGVPTLVVVDGSGEVVLTQIGRLDKKAVMQVIDTQ